MKRNTLKVKGLRTPRVIVFLHGAVDGRVTKKAGINPQNGVIESAYISQNLLQYKQACHDCVISLEKDIRPIRMEAAGLLAERGINRHSLELHAPQTVTDKAFGSGDGANGTHDASEDQIGLELSAANSHADHAGGGSKRKAVPTNAEEARAARLAAKEAAQREAARIHMEESKAEARKKAAEELKKVKELKEQAIKKQNESLIRLTRIREEMISAELLAEERLAETSEAVRALLCAYAHGAVSGAVSESHIPMISCGGWLDEYRRAHQELDQRITEVLNREYQTYGHYQEEAK